MELFIVLIARHFAGVVIFFPLIWLVMRVARKRKVGTGTGWFFVGLVATVIGVAAVRFVSIFVLGSELTLNPTEGLGVFFNIALPILFSLGVCIFIQTRMPD